MESVDSTSEVVAEPNDIGERNADEECDDGEYEETYLYVDFETKLLEEQLMNPNLQIKVLGVDTDAPIVQLNNKIFKGMYEYSMGSMLFFNENRQPLEPDPNFQEPPSQMFNYLAQTDKVLKMKRIFIEEIGAIDEDALIDGQIENLEHLRVTKSYEDALNQFLLPDEKPPRDLSKPTTDDDLSKDESANGTMGEASTSTKVIASNIWDNMEIDADVDAQIASNLEELLKDPDDIVSS